MISCKNISVKKGGNFILQNASFDLHPQELTVVLGPNGAGKSTLLKILTGLEKPTEGEVEVNQKLISQYSLKKLSQIRAVLSQQMIVNFSFTVMEIVLMGRHPFVEITEGKEDFEIAEIAMKQSDVLHLKNRIYSTLSGGEQQRVQLARVLAQIHGNKSEQQYLFLDEPVSSVDLKHKYMILQIAKDLANRGLGVFCILHDLNLAAQFADKIILMKEGKIMQYGSKDEVLTKKNLQNLFDVDDALIGNYLDNL